MSSEPMDTSSEQHEEQPAQQVQAEQTAMEDSSEEPATSPAARQLSGKMASFKKQFSLTVRSTGEAGPLMGPEENAVLLATPTKTEVEAMLEEDQQKEAAQQTTANGNATPRDQMDVATGELNRLNLQ